MNREQILARLEAIRTEAVALGDEFRTLSEAETLDQAQTERFNAFIAAESPLDVLARERAELERRLSVLDQIDSLPETGDDRSAPQHMRKVDPTAVDPIRGTRSEVRSAALKVIETEHAGKAVPVTDDAAALLEREFGRRAVSEDGETIFDGDLLARRLLVTETENYRSAFQKALRGHSDTWEPEERQAMALFRAAEQSLTSASGGYGVPVLIDPTIVLTSGAAVAPLLGVSRIERITNNIWKGVSSAGVAFAAVNEGSAGTVAAQQATLAQPTVTPETAAAFIPFSVEIEGDYPGFANEMARLIEAAYLDHLAKETAVGAAGLVGIFTAIDATVASEVAVTSDGILQPADAVKLWNALPERFKPRAVWFGNVTVESSLRNAAALGGLYTTNLSTEGIGPLFGKRFLLSDYAPAFTGTTGAANLAILGDFSHFVIAQRVGMSIEVVPHVFTGNLPTLQRGYIAWARVGSDSIADEAFRLLQNT